jgi:hypothetical protein
VTFPSSASTAPSTILRLCRPCGLKRSPRKLHYCRPSCMAKAFLDTTILADALLKVGADRDLALASFPRYEALLVPGFANKEFKRGPLRGYIWLHNKVVTTERWGDAIASIPSVWRQGNLSQTAMRAVADFSNSMAVANALAGEIPQDGAKFHALQSREARIWLKTKVTLAWRRRGRPPFVETAPLECYALMPINPEATERLEAACRESSKPEMIKRRRVLRAIRRRPRRETH